MLTYMFPTETYRSPFTTFRVMPRTWTAFAVIFFLIIIFPTKHLYIIFNSLFLFLILSRIQFPILSHYILLFYYNIFSLSLSATYKQLITYLASYYKTITRYPFHQRVLIACRLLLQYRYTFPVGPCRCFVTLISKIFLFLVSG